MHVYRRKAITLLLALMLTFLLVFILAFINLKKGRPLVDFGIVDYALENWIVIFLSIAAMIRVVVELYKVEHYWDYEMRVKKSEF